MFLRKKSCQNQNNQLAWQLAFTARQPRDNAAVQPTFVLVDNDVGTECQVTECQVDRVPSDRVPSDRVPSGTECQVDRVPSVTECQVDRVPSMTECQVDRVPSMTECQV